MTRMRRTFSGLSSRVTVVLTAGARVSGVGLVRVLGEQEDQPIDFAHNIRPGDKICTTNTQQTANVDTNCEKTRPSNETSIAVNPTNELNTIGGANDYQPAINPGGQVSETVLSRAHVTFDGGHTCSEYPDLLPGRIGVPRHGRPRPRVRRPWTRLLRHSGIPIRRPGERPQPRRHRVQLGRRRQDMVLRSGRQRQRERGQHR